MSQRRAFAVALSLLAVFAALGGGIVVQGERVRAAADREAASQVAAGAAFALEQQLSRSLSATYALGAIVRQNGRVDDFDALAGEMLRVYGGLASLQLAPGAVVTHIHPRAGNEAALGHDLLDDPDRRFQAREAVDSRQLTLAGPYQLRQGGFGAVGRLPVFLPDATAPRGERFWGLVSAVVLVDDLLAAARVARLAAEGYAFELWRLDPETGAVQRIAGSEAPLSVSPVSFAVTVPQGRWTLSVTPAGGWRPGQWLGAHWALAIAGAAVLAALAFVVLRQPEVLRREVAARTAELARANAQLAEDAERRRRVEADLVQAQKMEAVGQLAGGIAHDFNNALTGILAHASLLAEDSPPGSGVRETADVIVVAANRAADLTKQLLSFARRGRLAVAPIDVHEVAREVTRLLGRTLDKGIRIVERLDAAPSVLVADPAQLQHAILNLAVNARDAMPDGGELTISTAVVELDASFCERHPGTAPGRHLAISVADTGHGMSGAVVARIFEPFFTTKGPGRGTGMGLAMVYGFARSSAGAVSVESQPGRGARFTIHLPLPEVELLPAAARPDAPLRGSGRVLVVDDDAIPRAAAAAVLRDAGFDVVAVGTGEDAVRWFGAQRASCDAVLLDLAMPGMDGAACYRALRAIDPGVRVVLTSGHGQDARAEALLSEGIAGFTAKPFLPGELVQAILHAAAARAA